jgi:hypothetical protein
MSEAPRCLCCGRLAVAAHHVCSRGNARTLTVPACRAHHSGLDASLRRAGVPLSHRRTASAAEVVYALIAGMTSVFAAATCPIGSSGEERARVAEHLSFALRRLLLVAVPPEERGFGPEPLLAAANPARRRRQPPACVADPVTQLEEIFQLIAAGAHVGLSEFPEQAEYLRELEKTAAQIGAAAERLSEATATRSAELAALVARVEARLSELAALLLGLDLHSPDPEQLDCLRSTVTILIGLERHLFDFLAGLAEAADGAQAVAALERLLAEEGEL